MPLYHLLAEQTTLRCEGEPQAGGVHVPRLTPGMARFTP